MKWPMLKLHDICRPKQWPTISSGKLTGSGFPVYGANGRIGYYPEFNHAEPTILITCRGATCGTINICEPKSYVTGNSMALDDLDDRINLHFLAHYLRNRGLVDVISGSAQPQITREGLTKITVPVPSLDEQRRIAAILDQAEALRARRRQTLAKLDTLTQSLFLEMFGDPVRERGRWPVARIDSICRIVRGSSPRPQGDARYYGGPIPRLMVADLTRDGWLVTPRIDSLTNEGAKLSRPVPAGTVVMAVSGNVGLTSILAVDACIHDGFVGLLDLDLSAVAPHFLQALLTLLKATHEQRKAGAIFQNLTTTDIKAMEVPLPPRPLQEVFLKRLSAVSMIGNVIHKATTRLESLSASIQKRAFRGEL